MKNGTINIGSKRITKSNIRFTRAFDELFRNKNAWAIVPLCMYQAITVFNKHIEEVRKISDST